MQIIKKAKRGILPEETIKIIIAVICITLLIVLAAALYNIFAKKNDLEQARANMNNIIGKINIMAGELSNVEEGIKTESYALLNPREWGLYGWPDDGKMLGECEQQGWRRCICFCEIRWFKSNLERCKALNVCKEIKQDELLVEPNPIQINELLKKGKGKEIEMILEKENAKVALTIGIKE